VSLVGEGGLLQHMPGGRSRPRRAA
jgi:hypothetical protein